MLEDSKTVTSATTTDLDLYAEQTRDVEAMRASLLKFRKDDPNAARKEMQNITILRVYHQLERIVRYTSMIDKIEDRIYQSIDAKLDNSDPDDDSLWQTLIPIQERLQKMMIESHKLLEPYLNIEQLTALDVPKEEDPATSFTSIIMEQESREKVRTGVQELMAIISSIDSSMQEVTDKQEVQSKAQQALEQLTTNSEETTNA